MKLKQKLKQTPKQVCKIDTLYLLSFLIPTLILFIIFIIRKIYPFGDRSFLHIDMYHQYFPFLVEFYHKLKKGESLFYSWNTGIGSNFLALYVYYLASPFNWLCVLIPEKFLMEFLSYMVVLKTGLCGLSFTFYIRKHFSCNSWSVLCVSPFYALSGFMAAYNWDVMWLDVVVLAPLVILGIERLVNEGKCYLYCITLGLSILSNYYLSIMLCIFLVLYFFVLLIARPSSADNGSAQLAFPKLDKIKSFYVKAFIRFGIFSLLAGGMAAILLLPELAALRFTEFSDINFPRKVKTYFSVIDMLARHCFNVTVETGLDHWPNIYCGVAVFLMLPLYVMQKKIPLREKAPKLILLAFILISFSTNTLNFIWHGLNYPDSLPARQSFLYIFLLLTVCYEALIHIREHSGNEMMSLFLGILFFILLCEKLITDDSFTGACFLVTGIFLLIYAGFIHYYRNSYNNEDKNRENSNKFFCCCLILVVIAESGVNTYLTSVPTVSRTTYLSNHDSYQILTDRTVQNEGNDFFRFEKFARRTQNDAMLIGFHGGSYFSSTLNSLVSDFYEKYGMKGSRVNYCYDGATPVTAALLANRYMLYTIDRGYDNLFELADTEGKLYLYKNNYSLPLGYMVTEDDVDDESLDNLENLTDDTAPFGNSEEFITDDIFIGSSLNELFTDAEEIEENLHDDDKIDKNLNPIQRQNKLVRHLGINGDVFTQVEAESDGDQAYIYIEKDAHYYAYASNTKIDTIKLNYEEQSKSFSQIKKKYILDLGYHKAGERLSLKSENGESLNLAAYQVNEPVLSQFISRLSRQTLTIDSYTETSLYGHIRVTSAGQLVLAIPYDPGWTLYVDGAETDMDLFEDTFISMYLDEGTHSIELKYFPTGLIPGVIVSVICVLLFAGLYYVGHLCKKSK
ncbi:MAG: YfhO family protein [Lachnospiraceae bacterium]|nr:YfhO family protein [Lachnospiraceae bacterium]